MAGQRAVTPEAKKPEPREDSRRGNAAPARSGAKTSERPLQDDQTPAKPKRGRGRPSKHGDDAVVVSVRITAQMSNEIDSIVNDEASFYRDRSEFLAGAIAYSVRKNLFERKQEEENRKRRIGYFYDGEGVLQPVYKGEPKPAGFIPNPDYDRDHKKKLRQLLLHGPAKPST